METATDNIFGKIMNLGRGERLACMERDDGMIFDIDLDSYMHGEPFSRQVEDLLAGMSGKVMRCADIGAGIGRAAIRLAGLGMSVTAVEPDGLASMRMSGMSGVTVFGGSLREWIEYDWEVYDRIFFLGGNGGLMASLGPDRGLAFGMLRRRCRIGGEAVLELTDRHGSDSSCNVSYWERKSRGDISGLPDEIRLRLSHKDIGHGEWFDWWMPTMAEVVAAARSGGWGGVDVDWSEGRMLCRLTNFPG